MQIKTKVNAGGLTLNHQGGMAVKSGKKAGALTNNLNQTILPPR